MCSPATSQPKAIDGAQVGARRPRFLSLAMILIPALCGPVAQSATSVTGLESSTPLLSSAFGVRPPGSTSYPAVSNDNTAKTYGYSFTATASQLLVTHLGMFDSQYTVPTAGFYQDHRVGLWTVGGVLLAQVTLSAGNSNTLEGMFRYSALDSPLILVAGTTYVLGAYYPQVTGFLIDRLVNNVYMPTAADGFTLGTTQFRFGQNMPFPNVVAINKPYVGPTLRYEVIPEPSCLLIASSAASGFVIRRRPKEATHLSV